MPSAHSHPPSAIILLVDDNQLGLLARKSVLAEIGYQIVTCSDPATVLELCSKQQFDLVVTDYKMPSMSGVELISQLRAQKIDIPVILLSGFTDALGLNETNTGANAVIQKSANEVAHLIRAVNRLLKGPAKKPAGSQGGGGSQKKSAGS